MKIEDTKLQVADYNVHLWICYPKEITDITLLKYYREILSNDELIKINSKKNISDKHDALITRVFIRSVLSFYSDRHPKDWKFKNGPNGKPGISNYKNKLKFNLSHTKGLIICAVTTSNDIGCDVERTKRNKNVLRISERFFSKLENDDLSKLNKDQQLDRFFEYWTLKEAFIKADGTGMSTPLDSFGFKLDHPKLLNDDRSIDVVFMNNKAPEASYWLNHLINFDEEYKIAISVKYEIKENNLKGTNLSIKSYMHTPLLNYTQI